MDPIESIHTHKDSSFAMLLSAQSRGWELYYMEMADIFLKDGHVQARKRKLEVQDNPEHWFDFIDDQTSILSELDCILMRKDPPFNMEYIYATYLLEHAESEGLLVVNRPSSLRDANEKLFTAWFPQCCPPTLVSRTTHQLRAFLDKYQDIILKPLDGMGGASIFRVAADDPNISVIIETLTSHGQQFTMAQQFIPEITAGDKRILLIDGKPVDYALARIPADGETRGNLAAGGYSKGVELTERDRWICSQVAPILQEKGLIFVGLDVIGDYLTEINVTSPTCIRELDRLFDLDIATELISIIEQKLL